MPSSKTDLIGILSDEKGAELGTLHSLVYSSGERTGRALKMLAIAWLLAGITLFIPIAHFFLVPIFVIAGPVMAWSRYRAEVVPEKVTGICPECGEEITIDLDPSDKLPKWSYCPKCNKSLHLVYDAPSPEQSSK